MLAAENSTKYVLGLDLGSASLGWALIAVNELDRPGGLMRAGVRIFEPGVAGTQLEIEEGKDQSKAVARRTARLQRRQTRRRAHRQGKLFRLLQQRDLLPDCAGSASLSAADQRNAILTALDDELCRHVAHSHEANSFAQLPIYHLRKDALDRKLELYELGRVLYHLSQRRGFKSNRKEGSRSPQKEKETDAVKEGIADLGRAIKAAGARTLGEYFAGLDPHEKRVRGRWTSRRMYEDEFELIWQTQSQFYPAVLTQELRRQVAHLLYFQRPVAAQSHLIGKCELESDQRRAPWATLEAQRFRILQKVNDLKLIYAGNPVAQPLTAVQRQLVFELLDRGGDQTFKALGKTLKLEKGTSFNLEGGGETKLRGNRTNVAMHAAFGDRWMNLSAETQKHVVEEWRTSESETALLRRAIDCWGLDEQRAARWVETKPETGYCALSRRAIEKLVPLMEAGKPFKEAETELYGHRFSGGPVLDLLPPFHVHRKMPGSAHTERLLAELRLAAVRNPAVERALTELRKVVNAIIREYGKPYEIRIELARELKKPRKERQVLAKKNRSRQKEREEAKAALLRECRIQNPSREDIDKALLHAECGGICPYTGKSISLRDLFGPTPQFDVEHIIPLSRYPDDSFQNKTLCWHAENRNFKRNRTPFEAYSPDAGWEEILERVRAWPLSNPGKLKRFLLRTEDELEEFTARQMNDTRYASVLACRLLQSLYGGRDVQCDNRSRQVVFASSGAVTATLRRCWQLESILREAAPSANGQSKGKPRSDHRHHAIDAIVVGSTSRAAIQALSRAASADRNGAQNARAFRSIPAPWPDFIDSVRCHIERMVVSHRPEHKLSGALHKETLYGKPYRFREKTFVNVRRRISELSDKQVEDIVDDQVRSAVKAKLAENGGSAKSFILDKPETLPFLVSRNGVEIPIKRARVRESATLETLRQLPGDRYVEPNSIHHVAIFVVRENGSERWEGVFVDMMEAYYRTRSAQPVVNRTLPTGEAAEAQFLFSLMKGDTVEMDHEGATRVCRVKKFYAGGQIWFTTGNNAQRDEDLKRSRATWSKRPNTMKAANVRKVVVDVLGRVHPAND